MTRRWSLGWRWLAYSGSTRCSSAKRASAPLLVGAPPIAGAGSSRGGACGQAFEQGFDVEGAAAAHQHRLAAAVDVGDGGFG